MRWRLRKVVAQASASERQVAQSAVMISMYLLFENILSSTKKSTLQIIQIRAEQKYWVGK